jgi:hypothetical protein
VCVCAFLSKSVFGFIFRGQGPTGSSVWPSLGSAEEASGRMDFSVWGSVGFRNSGYGLRLFDWGFDSRVWGLRSQRFIF